MGESETGYQATWGWGFGGFGVVFCDACPIWCVLSFGDCDGVSVSGVWDDEGCALFGEGAVSEVMGVESGSGVLGALGALVWA